MPHPVLRPAAWQWAAVTSGRRARVYSCAHVRVHESCSVPSHAPQATLQTVQETETEPTERSCDDWPRRAQRQRRGHRRSVPHTRRRRFARAADRTTVALSEHARTACGSARAAAYHGSWRACWCPPLPDHDLDVTEVAVRWKAPARSWPWRPAIVPVQRARSRRFRGAVARRQPRARKQYPGSESASPAETDRGDVSRCAGCRAQPGRQWPLPVTRDGRARSALMANA